jgi:AraC family transcriptional regulator
MSITVKTRLFAPAKPLVQLGQTMMNPVDRAIWYIESNLQSDLSLTQVADMANVSTFHLTRAFANRSGFSVMRYVWKRRLSNAARNLFGGKRSVLDVALDAQYNSHEAFSRAFKSEFGIAPSRVKSDAALLKMNITKPLVMRHDMPRTLNRPTVETMPKRIIAGLSRRYSMETRTEIPAQWGQYNMEDITLPHSVPDCWYGVVYNFGQDSSFDYMSGMEVTKAGDLPNNRTSFTVPAGRFARFVSKAHISTMGQAWTEIYEDWLSQPEYKPRPGPSVEFYPLEFDGMTGDGGFELWVPVE